MIICPLCGHKNPVGTIDCKKCSAELQNYEKLYYIPDVLYNKALNLCKQSEYAEAIEILSTANRMRAKDKGILAAMVTAYRYLGNHSAALEKCYEILEIGDDEEYARIAEELSEILNRETYSKERIRDTLKRPLNEIMSKTHASINDRLGEIMGAVTGVEWDEDRFVIDITASKQRMDENKEEQEDTCIEEQKDVSEENSNPVIEGPTVVDAGASKIKNIPLAMLVSVSLLMVIGFGLLYWKLTDNIKYQTDSCARSTIEQVVTMNKDLTNQVNELSEKQKELGEQLKQTENTINQLNSELINLAENSNSNEEGLKQGIQQVQMSVEKIENGVEQLEAITSH